MRKLSLLALVLGLAACRGDSGDDAPGVDSNTGGGDVTIQEVQAEAMPSGTPVTLKGVVVTAIDAYGSKTGDFWVQEPAGGEFSGIHVYGAPLDQVAALAIGDVVDIKGAEKDDFMYSDFQPGYAITELKPVAGGEMDVSKTGSSMVLQPTVVNAAMIGGLPDYMARDAEWEKWEGVLITIQNVTASNDQDCVGSACSDPTLQKIEVTGGVVLESALAAFPVDSETSAATAWKRGDCITSATGVLDYFFDYLLLPRTTAEYGMEGTSCPTEDSAQLCGDGMDNDGNGFADCEDNSCAAATASCRTVMTIQQIQTATTPPTTAVEIQGVFVTALQRVTGTNKPRNMYIQSAAAASVSNGVLVFGGSSDDLSAFTPGTKVNVIGRVKEFNDSMNNGTGTLTEVQLISVTAATGNGNITPVTGQTPTLLQVDATGELHESVLVRLENVKLKTVGDSMYHVGTMSDGGGLPFKFDDDLYRIIETGTGAVAADTCIDVIDGIWSYQVYDNAWYFLPISAPDVVGGNCPFL